MISLAKLIDGTAEEMETEELQQLYHQADADGDKLAMQLILKEMEKRK